MTKIKAKRQFCKGNTKVKQGSYCIYTLLTLKRTEAWSKVGYCADKQLFINSAISQSVLLTCTIVRHRALRKPAVGHKCYIINCSILE